MPLCTAGVADYRAHVVDTALPHDIAGAPAERAPLVIDINGAYQSPDAWMVGAAPAQESVTCGLGPGTSTDAGAAGTPTFWHRWRATSCC